MPLVPVDWSILGRQSAQQEIPLIAKQSYRGLLTGFTLEYCWFSPLSLSLSLSIRFESHWFCYLESFNSQLNGLRFGSRCSNRCTPLLDATLGFTASEDITDSDFETVVKESARKSAELLAAVFRVGSDVSASIPSDSISRMKSRRCDSGQEASYRLNRSPIRFSGWTPTQPMTTMGPRCTPINAHHLSFCFRFSPHLVVDRLHVRQRLSQSYQSCSKVRLNWCRVVSSLDSVFTWRYCVCDHRSDVFLYDSISVRLRNETPRQWKLSVWWFKYWLQLILVYLYNIVNNINNSNVINIIYLYNICIINNIIYIIILIILNYTVRENIIYFIE